MNPIPRRKFIRNSLLAAAALKAWPLVAQSPNDSAKPGEYAEVEAIFAIEPGHPFKGVRVHGASNRVMVVGLPGYSAAAAPPKNCVDCTGKLFVPKGQTVPANRPATTIVREEELPSTLRVIRESDVPVPILRDRASAFRALPTIVTRITDAIDERGNILDRASPELSRVRTRSRARRTRRATARRR